MTAPLYDPPFSLVLVSPEWILASWSLKNMYFTDFGSGLQENGAFWRSKFFLKVAIKFKDLKFTFIALVGPVGPLRDTGKCPRKNASDP
jgi:hypothetical protein